MVTLLPVNPVVVRGTVDPVAAASAAGAVATGPAEGPKVSSAAVSETATPAVRARSFTGVLQDEFDGRGFTLAATTVTAGTDTKGQAALSRPCTRN
jgi:hypothetical protein